MVVYFNRLKANFLHNMIFNFFFKVSTGFFLGGLSEVSVTFGHTVCEAAELKLSSLDPSQLFKTEELTAANCI